MDFSYTFWLGFLVFITAAIFVDLVLLGESTPSVRQSLGMTICWTLLAGLFALLLYLYSKPTHALEFATGYIMELSLSMDNVFVIAMIFSYFKVPQQYQHRVLFWGVFGAIVMRFIFIWAGVSLVQHFQPILYVFGLFLIFTAYKMLVMDNVNSSPENSMILRFLEKYMPVTMQYHGHNFFIRSNGRLTATPLFITLILVEQADLVFAIDSIPAILAITQNTFVVFTSNVFAILGLRSLYFLLASAVNHFQYLHYGLSIMLFYIGLKMLLVMVGIHLSISITLAIILACLGGSIGLSLLYKK